MYLLPAAQVSGQVSQVTLTFAANSHLTPPPACSLAVRKAGWMTSSPRMLEWLLQNKPSGYVKVSSSLWELLTVLLLRAQRSFYRSAPLQRSARLATFLKDVFAIRQQYRQYFTASLDSAPELVAPSLLELGGKLVGLDFYFIRSLSAFSNPMGWQAQGDEMYSSHALLVSPGATAACMDIIVAFCCVVHSELQKIQEQNSKVEVKGNGKEKQKKKKKQHGSENNRTSSSSSNSTTGIGRGSGSSSSGPGCSSSGMSAWAASYTELLLPPDHQCFAAGPASLGKGVLGDELVRYFKRTKLTESPPAGTLGVNLTAMPMDAPRHAVHALTGCVACCIAADRRAVNRVLLH